MRKTRRTSRVGETIRDALVLVFRQDLKGIDLAMVSITGVDVSPDLHFARVYISGLTEDATKEIVAQLQKAKGKARHALGQRIHLRYTPELDFKYDDTAMRAGRIEDLLKEVLPPQPAPENTADEDDDEQQDDEQS